MSWSPRCRRCQSLWCPKDKCEARHDVFYVGDRARFVDFKHPKNGEIVEILSGGRVFTHARIRFADSTTHVTELHYHLYKIVDRKCVSSPNTDDSDSESESDSESDSDSYDENEDESKEVAEIDNFGKYEEHNYSSCNGKGCSVGPDMCDECRLDYAEYLAD